MRVRGVQFVVVVGKNTLDRNVGPQRTPIPLSGEFLRSMGVQQMASTPTPASLHAPLLLSSSQQSLARQAPPMQSNKQVLPRCIIAYRSAWGCIFSAISIDCWQPSPPRTLASERTSSAMPLRSSCMANAEHDRCAAPQQASVRELRLRCSPPGPHLHMNGLAECGCQRSLLDGLCMWVRASIGT